MRDHTSNSALILFYFFAKDTREGLSYPKYLWTSSSPFQTFFFQIFSLQFLLLQLTFADHFFF